MEIELESRSKGFQWFFSFYLVFLVESEEGHKDSIILLDEPGLHLHPTAQQEPIGFYETLSEKNQILYTTHSPFLIDGDHIHRVRPVTEDENGHASVGVGSWPKDRETIFPLQAAAGYAMVRGLFSHKRNLLVEGMSDYLYLHSLSLICSVAGRDCLLDDIYVTPCGGTRMVGHLASLFLGEDVRPLVLLDGDDAGKVRRDALLKELYVDNEDAVLLLDTVLNNSEPEIEDIFDEAFLLPLVNKVFLKTIRFNQDDRNAGNIVKQIFASAERNGSDVPAGWKAQVARLTVQSLNILKPDEINSDILDRAEKLFNEIKTRFDKINLKP